jgi:putative ABC transport system substrate-binding protein
MKRREFIGLVGGALAWPLKVRAQQADRRVGVLMGFEENDPVAQTLVAGLRQELQKLGWEDGRNIHIDVRFPGANAGRVRSNLAELMSRTPDVLVSSTNLVTAVVQAEVHNIPVVFTIVGDPVGSGFVDNEVRPNANLTGFANWERSMSGKWLELFREIAPQIDRVGFMLHPETIASNEFLKFAETAAPALKVKLVPLAVHDADEIERALTAFAAEGSGGFIVTPHAVTTSNRDLIAALAARLRLPAVYPFAFFARAGGLISYSFDAMSQIQQGAGYVDRVLRGAKPADLPIQYPTKYELIVNLKTAKALRLAIPESFLTRADEVIE